MQRRKKMLVELITPLMLASAPQAVTAGSPMYDHASQSAYGSNKSANVVVSYASTQTYDFQGRPNDSDMD
jgi:hypothetical protein